MGRTAAYVVVAEDRAGMRFVEQYLRSIGVDSRAIRSRYSPPGRGSGKQWVTTTYPAEVRGFREKKNHVWKVLLVVTDADELSVAERVGQLARSLADAGSAPRADEERIALVIPKWEIETWAEHLLTGAPVTEDAKMGWPVARSGRDSHAAGGKLLGHRGAPKPSPGCCPPSLEASDVELARVRR
jgi:hypothetical protein